MVQAAVLNAPHTEVSVEEFPFPVMEEGSIVLKTLYSEVCGTDVHLLHGRLAGVPYPIIPGHINVGIIEKIKGSVYGINGHLFQKGETVTFFDVHETCNKCWYCLVAKAATRCPERKVYGITYSCRDGLLGGWSEYIYLKPGVKLISLGEKMNPLDFIAGGCGLVTSFHAVERSGTQLGDTVVIQGTGPVGLSAIAWARMAGAYKIVAVGAPELRIVMAGKMGADEVVNIDEYNSDDRIEKIKEFTDGRGADVTIECSGNPQAVREGMQMTRDGGSFLVVGQYTDAGSAEINPHYDINKKHLTLKGCWGFDYSHIYKAVKMMIKYQNEFPWKEFVSKIFTLHEANEALQAVEGLNVIKAVIKP